MSISAIRNDPKEKDGGLDCFAALGRRMKKIQMFA
jgi:hypothetical protein